MKPVVTEFLPYIHPDQQTAANSYSKSDNVYQRIEFAFLQMAKGDFEVIPDHGFMFRSLKCSNVIGLRFEV